MHIVLQTVQFLPSVGGLQMVADYWASAWTNAGHTVTVITDTPDKDMSDQHRAYTVLRGLSKTEQLFIMRRANIVVSFNISLRHFWPVILSQRPWVVSHHTSLGIRNNRLVIIPRIKRMIANRFVHLNVACSDFIASEYKKSVVVHSPYQPAVFKNNHLPRLPNSVLFVGRLVRDKGVDMLIKAIAILRFRKQRYQLTIIGDGPEMRSLKLLVSRLNLGEQIAFLGALNQTITAKHYNTHQILVIPSRIEPFGIVALEGLACGCQVITSNVGGLKEAGSHFAYPLEQHDEFRIADIIDRLSKQPQPKDETEVADFLKKLTPDFTANKFLQLLKHLD